MSLRAFMRTTDGNCHELPKVFAHMLHNGAVFADKLHYVHIKFVKLT